MMPRLNITRPVAKLRSRDRRGLNLVEMIIWLSLWATVVSLLTPVIVKIVRFNDMAGEQIDLVRSSLNLSQRFRDDWRTAVTQTYERRSIKERGEYPMVLRLDKPDDRVVEYTLDGSSIHRVELEDGKMTRRDIFLFPPETHIDWIFVEHPAFQRGGIRILPDGKANAETLRELQVVSCRSVDPRTPQSIGP